MFSAIRNKRVIGKVAIFMMVIFLIELFAPSAAFALTGGPSQPEVQSFEPMGTSEMVDTFSGDFVYNIPLLDVGGYPINISYHGGPSMDQEASWVGLGWNINPGAITRDVRGLPDDFNGIDKVTKTFSMKDNRTYGVNTGIGLEVFGMDGLNIGVSYAIGVRYNNYVGVGFEQMLGANLSLSLSGSNSGALNADLGISSSGDEGLNINPSVGFSMSKMKNESADKYLDIRVGASYNSRQGLKTLTYGASLAKNRLLSLGLSGTVNFAATTYTPSFDFSTQNVAISMRGNLGVTIYGLNTNFDLGGYFSQQSIIDNEITSDAFGYLHSHKSYNYENNPDNPTPNLNALLDFNREKDGPFNKHTPNLPVTNLTYDVLSVTGQGVSGTYRPFRGDIGYVYDRAAKNLNDDGSLGIEIGASQTAHIGIDVQYNDVNTKTGLWQSNNDALASLRFKGSVDNNILYEPYYFKEIGEKSVNSNSGLFQNFRNSDAVSIELEEAGGYEISAASKLRDKVNEYPWDIESNTKQVRDKRNQVITYLDFDEAKKFGLQRDLYDPNLDGNILAYPATLNQEEMDEKNHHIAEITVLRTDGSRYVYGLPLYNTDLQEITFNVAGSADASSCNTGLVYYNPGTDNSTSNERNIDSYYSNTKTDPYAHAYLLTAVVSSDYVDLGNDGPSEDDLGTYTKFIYSDAGINEYEWRVPVEPNQANYFEGTKPIATDDKGSYIYGKKEIKYLDRIETKTHIAKFILEDRKDGYGVNDENGLSSFIGNTSKTKRLKEIVLYTRPFNDDITNAVPVKTVHFEYDYSLCGKVPNNNTLDEIVQNQNSEDVDLNANEGKLTLKKIYFTYGKSYKGRFSPYEFIYSEFNPNYHIKGYDRWGNYKQNNADCSPTGSQLPNAEFPYVEQGIIPGGLDNEDLYFSHSGENYADVNAEAWSLKQIKLPSGGLIEVEYEADDYAYVQDRPANQMFKIAAMTAANFSENDVPDFNSSNLLYGNSGGCNYIEDHLSSTQSCYEPNLRVYIKLQEPISLTTNTNAEATTIFRKQYLNQIIEDKLYFRAMVDLTDNDDYEYVSGYAKIDKNGSYGVISRYGTDYDYAYFTLENVDAGNLMESFGGANPINKAAMQFSRLYLPALAWDMPEISEDGDPDLILDVFDAIAGSSIIGNIMKMIEGPDAALISKGYSREINPDKSWVRLQNPNGKKKGGGHRVKKIQVWDQWGKMMGDPDETLRNFQYGQEYNYTTWEGGKLHGREISSGVASYEPLIGGDENPFRQPYSYKEDYVLVPDETFYVDEPFGESFFPAPMVGYSKVTVRNLQRENVTRHATGKTVYEYYTAKDFPTKADRTDLIKKKKNNNPQFLLSLFQTSVVDYITASQGFVVEVNDMHGKPKGQKIFREDDEEISSVEYIYKTDPLDEKHLDNRVPVIFKEDGTRIDEQEIGVEFDAVADFRENNTEMKGVNIAGNLESFLVSAIYAAIPLAFPNLGKQKTRMRSAGFTKVIYRYGLLERVIAKDRGSVVTTENLAYDAETGEVLLTKTNNNFDDPVYSFSYPAHWGYDRMGPAYQNIGAEINLGVLGSAPFNQPNGNLIFVPGDELICNPANGNKFKAWVWSPTSDVFENQNTNWSADEFYLIDETGELIENTDVGTVKIIRSGRRNMQSLAIGAITSKKNPLKINEDDVSVNLGGPLSYFINSLQDNEHQLRNIINAQAVEFDEKWGIFCGLQNVCGTMSLANILQSSNCSCLKAPDGNAYQWYDGNGNPISGGTTQFLNISTGGMYSVQVTMQNGCSYMVGPIEVSASGTNCRDCSLATYPASTEFLATPMTNENNSCGSVISEHAPVNPYLKGLRGNWRPKVTYAYLSNRTESMTSASGNNSDIQNDGLLLTRGQTSIGGNAGFQPFWKPGYYDYSQYFKPERQYWTATTEITKYSPYGMELENKDALDRHSSALFGFNNTLATAVASNARYNDIVYDSYEDYIFTGSNPCNTHFDFLNQIASGAHVSLIESHTGKCSFQLNPLASVSETKQIVSSSGDPGEQTDDYNLRPDDCIGAFSPKPGKYVLSLWVKQSSPSYAPVFNPACSPEITVYDQNQIPTTLSSNFSNSTRSEVIEGWQRIEMTFDIPANSTFIKVAVNNESPSQNVFFDDMRIHPFDASLKSFAYDPVTLRLMAELDENNFATFYEYDEEGMMTRVKKETERGIVTLQETRNATVKKATP